MVTGDDGIIDGELNSIPSDAANDPSQRLAASSYPRATSGYGVVDGSVESNMVLFDTGTEDSGTPPNGLALEYRLDHDVLAEPDLGTVIINIGLEDVLWEDGVSDEMAVVGDAVQELASQLFPLRRGRRDRRRHADPVQRLPVVALNRLRQHHFGCTPARLPGQRRVRRPRRLPRRLRHGGRHAGQRPPRRSSLPTPTATAPTFPSGATAAGTSVPFVASRSSWRASNTAVPRRPATI